MFKIVRLSVFEFVGLLFTATIVIVGIVIAQIDLFWFENAYAAEDGFIENWTVVPLIIAALHAIYLLTVLGNHRKWPFKVVLSLIVLFSIFVAGEEISWGQRIFNVQSSHFFQHNNTQGETNLHNMMIGDTKVNKLVFSQLLTVFVGVYLLIIPVLHSRAPKLKRLLDNLGIPIPKLYHTVCCLLLFISISFIPSGKNAEILEAGITTLFLLIFMFPRNAYVYARPVNGAMDMNAPIDLRSCKV